MNGIASSDLVEIPASYDNIKENHKLDLYWKCLPKLLVDPSMDK